jgi:hypothetical protein
MTAARPARPVTMSTRTLWPREHGAYFQLALPLLAVGARRVPSLAMIVLALAAAAVGWSLGFAASTIAVHRVIARHKHAATWVDRVCALVLAGGFAVCLWRATSGGAFVIAAPLVGLAAAVVAVPPSARWLRAIGLATVAAGLLAGVLETLASVRTDLIPDSSSDA